MAEMTVQAQSATETDSDAVVKRSFIGMWWHATFLAIATGLAQPSTVIAAFINDLTGSTAWVGALSTVLQIAVAVPQLAVARWLESRPRKMPTLLAAIYLRVLPWVILAWLIPAIGPTRPQALAWALVGLFTLFSLGGGLGGVPYTDIIGKVIPRERRGSFFAGRQLLTGVAGIGAALLSRQVLAVHSFPHNYAFLFALSAGAMFVASIGFWLIHEPSDGAVRPVASWGMYWRQIGEAAAQMKVYAVVQFLTSFSMLAMPFYVVYARQKLGAPADAVGWFTLAQVLGGTLANLLWGWLIDRYGCWRTLAAASTLATVAPLSAVLLSPLGWPSLLLVVFLSGAAMSGRMVAFASAFLALAPADRRPTYVAVSTWLSLPMALLPFGAGVLLQHWSYAAVFALTGVIGGAGALLTWFTGRGGQVPGTVQVELIR